MLTRRITTDWSETLLNTPVVECGALKVCLEPLEDWH